MLTVLRLTWRSVDDLQWAVVRASLNTTALSPHGCLSWHSRRTRDEVHVSALWDDQHGAQIFREGPLADVAVAARLDPPTVTLTAVPGTYARGSRPVSAQCAPAAVSSQRRVA